MRSKRTISALLTLIALLLVVSQPGTAEMLSPQATRQAERVPVVAMQPGATPALQVAQGMNPCAAKANPCAAKANPCAAKANPCGAAANPCAAKSGGPTPIRADSIRDHGKLVAMGKDLWNDRKLGTSGLTCMNCHVNHALLNLDMTKGRFPHFVKMPNDIVTLDQMINFCMVNPMKAKPLEANSITMTAIAAYFNQLVDEYNAKPAAAPGASKGKAKTSGPANPCAAK
ncbi:MAG: hypothetical protein HYY96_16310 [Candidatus Tectomicrobia bacterium]|nr:hypothetical protein [Candidatus Tectomicrobia bacterium]